MFTTGKRKLLHDDVIFLQQKALPGVKLVCTGGLDFTFEADLLYTITDSPRVEAEDEAPN